MPTSWRRPCRALRNLCDGAGRKRYDVLGRLLALDLGERRIGVAVSDPHGSLVLPVGHLERSKLQKDIDQVLELARARQAQAFVVGMPYDLSGEMGYRAGQVQGFVRALRRRTDLPVHIMDERFTSYEAEALLREAGQQPSRDRGSVDAAAAVLILERYLSLNGLKEASRGLDVCPFKIGG
jgi:putative Holliday junction resolvase